MPNRHINPRRSVTLGLIALIAIGFVAILLAALPDKPSDSKRKILKPVNECARSQTRKQEPPGRHRLGAR